MFRYYKFVIFMSLILALSCSTENNIEVPPTEIPVQGRSPSERGGVERIEEYPGDIRDWFYWPDS